MDFSKLSAGDRRNLILAGIATIGGIVAVIDEWGPGSIFALLGSLAALFLVVQPQVAPNVKVPMPKATSMLVASGVAAVGFLLGALAYPGALPNIGRVYNLIFDIGLIASLVLVWFAWTAYSAGRPATAASAPAAPAAAAAAPQPESPPPVAPEG